MLVTLMEGRTGRGTGISAALIGYMGLLVEIPCCVISSSHRVGNGNRKNRRSRSLADQYQGINATHVVNGAHAILGR